MKQQKRKASAASITLNIGLLLSFIVTILAPLTGVPIHKLASTLFLLLSVIHTILYRKRFGAKKMLMLLLIVLSFASGILARIWEQYPIIAQLHDAISIASVFFLAIHIFVYRKRLKGRDNNHDQ